MTESHVGHNLFTQRHDSFTQRHDSFTQRHDSFTQRHDSCTQRHDSLTQRHDSFTCETWLIRMQNVTDGKYMSESYEWVSHVHKWVMYMSESCVAFKWGRWHIHTDMTHSPVRHDAFTRETWLKFYMSHGMRGIRILSLFYGSFAKETYNFTYPTMTHILHELWHDSYGVAMISRLLKTIPLFGRILSLFKGSFSKETYNFIDPTNRSHPIVRLIWGGYD